MQMPDAVHAPPSAAEVESRVARVRNAMLAARVDAAVVVDPYNVFYLTNFYNYVHERPFVLVVPADGPLRFVVPRLEESHVEVRAVGAVERVRYDEFPAPAGERWSDRLREILPDVGRIAVESACPLQVLDEIAATAVRVDLVDEVRMIKSPYEIGRIRHACEIVSAGHRRLLEGCRPGALAIGLFGDVTRWMIGQMLRDIPNANMLASDFAAIVQPPSLSHDPHNFTDVFMQLVDGGPHVSVINCRVNGYGAELERTFFLGSVPDTARAPFDAMLEARRIAFEGTRPGESMADVDRAVRECFGKRGYGDAMLHRTGHSFGVTGHEAPFLAVGYEREIRPGMLFSIEPAIYLPGIGGFRHSDTVLVTETGNVCLTEASDALEDVVLPV